MVPFQVPVTFQVQVQVSGRGVGLGLGLVVVGLLVIGFSKPGAHKAQADFGTAPPRHALLIGAAGPRFEPTHRWPKELCVR